MSWVMKSSMTEESSIISGREKIFHKLLKWWTFAVEVTHLLQVAMLCTTVEFWVVKTLMWTDLPTQQASLWRLPGLTQPGWGWWVEMTCSQPHILSLNVAEKFTGPSVLTFLHSVSEVQWAPQVRIRCQIRMWITLFKNLGVCLGRNELHREGLNVSTVKAYMK